VPKPAMPILRASAMDRSWMSVWRQPQDAAAF